MTELFERKTINQDIELSMPVSGNNLYTYLPFFLLPGPVKYLFYHDLFTVQLLLNFKDITLSFSCFAEIWAVHKPLKPFYNNKFLEAGCDEAGRGCLAGPVYAGAVIFPKNYKNPHLNDSKLLTLKERLFLRNEIQREAIAWAVGVATHEEIDEINILNASFLAMHRAIEQLKTKPEFLLIDGNRFNPFKKIPFKCIVKGDSKFSSIAAASILAKTYRDEHMEKIHDEFPHYNWKSNKGYAVKAHRKAIEDNGICTYHRKSFTLLEPQLELELEFED